MKNKKEYHIPSYIPTEEDLNEFGFYKDDIGLWICETYDEDVCGMTFPCLITWHEDAGYFLVGGNYFSPRSKEALKHIVEAFTIGPNEKIMKEIVKKKYKGIV